MSDVVSEAASQLVDTENSEGRTTTIGILRDRFASATTLDEMIEGAKVNQELWRAIRRRSQAPAELVERLRLWRDLPSPGDRRRIRERAGCSLRDVAGAVGVSQMAIVRWETGSKPRNPDHLRAYSRLLGELERIGARERRSGPPRPLHPTRFDTECSQDWRHRAKG